ncbi:hypothetical protein K402DRAFT_390400 [Aulographum hederae CBS 113979]|uniref:Uncharacterized protein n=1 Tax=Aulographum hederae CBS 113979 TaxID=1176131 RepID=A0A6G1HAJ8_9PEZI|nr:hypothetical protein K402DRAFT_390400 [Aulographum hederae CBS 113979]
MPGHSTENGRCAFLELAGELRNAIYEDLYYDSTVKGSKNLGLLLTCKKIYQETKYLAFANTTFSIDEKFNEPRWMGLPQQLRDCIQLIEMHVECSREPDIDSLGRFLNNQKLGSKVKTLVFDGSRIRPYTAVLHMIDLFISTEPSRDLEVLIAEKDLNGGACDMLELARQLKRQLRSVWNLVTYTEIHASLDGENMTWLTVQLYDIHSPHLTIRLLD